APRRPGRRGWPAGRQSDDPGRRRRDLDHRQSVDGSARGRSGRRRSPAGAARLVEEGGSFGRHGDRRIRVRSGQLIADSLTPVRAYWVLATVIFLNFTAGGATMPFFALYATSLGA